MRASHIFSCGLVLVFVLSAHAEDKPNVLTGGDFSVAAPEGFKWVRVGESHSGDLSATTYVATREGSTGRIIVAVQPGAVASDATRISKAKGFYEGIVEELPKIGLTLVKGALPDLKPPVPDRVVIPMVFKDAMGHSLALRAIVLFGKKNTYHFQVADQTEETAEELAKTVESLKE